MKGLTYCVQGLLWLFHLKAGIKPRLLPRMNPSESRPLKNRPLWPFLGQLTGSHRKMLGILRRFRDSMPTNLMTIDEGSAALNLNRRSMRYRSYVHSSQRIRMTRLT